MKTVFVVIAALLGLSAIIQLFEKNTIFGLSVIIFIVLFLIISIKKERKKLSSLSPEELKQKALKEYHAEENHQRLKKDTERDKERDKEIRQLKSHIKCKLGMDVNPVKKEIDINGIFFRVENRHTRFLPVLIGRFYCKDCGHFERIIDDISEYGYLLQRYQEHIDKCMPKI